MSDLKSFAALQARVFEFLEQQDEATLQAIASGAARLAVAGADAAPPVRLPVNSPGPWQVAQELSALASEDERLRYLNSAKLPVKALRDVARSVGLRGYSGLTRAKLIAVLASHGPNGAAPDVTEASTPAPPPAPAETTRPDVDVDVAAVAARLRELDSEALGAAYLHDQRLDRETLLAVAAELQLTRVTRLSQPELEKRVLKQAIGARRKFAGLRNW
ncbi:hypothetical protein AB0J40_12990 [Amycolatopsis sp. NPDC049691]|uniref:hypothetical protein n=1 Tax=Amycolatopsis sp. NPDC049691 TaxID=3155155 RepID=UPI00342336AC